jgi:hypothetical protein
VHQQPGPGFLPGQQQEQQRQQAFHLLREQRQLVFHLLQVQRLEQRHQPEQRRRLEQPGFQREQRARRQQRLNQRKHRHRRHR